MVLLQHIYNHPTWIYCLPGKWLKKTIKHISTINFEDIFKEAEHFSEQMNNSLEDLKLSENELLSVNYLNFVLDQKNEWPMNCVEMKLHLM